MSRSPSLPVRAARRRRLPQVVAATLVSVALAGGCSSDGGSADAATDGATTPTIVGGTSSGATSSGRGSATATTGDLFDNTKVHDVEITYDKTAYDAMIAEFQSSGDKKWIEATVTVDGTTVKKAGIRLKGNSSLMGLRNTGNTGNGGRAGGPGGAVSAEAPNGLPWLVRLDKYVDGQKIKGTSEFVIRSNNSQTSLNEAVALEVLTLSGQVSQRSFATRFSVNGGAEKLRLAIENPGDDWEDENFPNDGVLYKAESGGDYSYRGEVAESYKDAFDQESDKDNENYQPLIDFLKFVNQSDDATFAATLGDHLDVASFARYLAGQVLVNNFDDIDGPGNNSYLRYDVKTKKMTIVSWDLNLAFGGLGGGGGQIPGGGQAPGGGFTPPTGATGAFPGGGRGAGGGGAPGGAGGFGGRTNILVTRFNANPQFKALYDKALADMKAQVYASGKAAEVLARWQKLLTSQASDLVPATTIDSEAASIARNFTA